jgi:hypothetical protein
LTVAHLVNPIAMLSIIILAILITAPWLRVARPGGARLDGRVIHDQRLPLLARLRMHAVPGTLTLLGAFAMWVWWDLPWWGPVAATVDTGLLISMPVRYTLTTLGIRAGWTPFRRWTEFAGVSRMPGGARLQGAAGTRDKRIWLSSSRGDDEFVALLRRMIKGAYKGQNVLLEYPPKGAESPGSTAAATEITRTAV